MNVDAVGRLNELLEAERAGVETCQALLKTVPKGYFRNHLAKIEADEAFSCAVLERAIRGMGGEPSHGKNDFTQKVLALDTLEERLNLLARGQMWVVKRLDAVAEAVTGEGAHKELAEMRHEHVANVDWCNAQVADLKSEG